MMREASHLCIPVAPGVTDHMTQMLSLSTKVSSVMQFL